MGHLKACVARFLRILQEQTHGFVTETPQAEICQLLDAESLRILLTAVRAITDSPDGFGTIEVKIAKRQVSGIQVTTSLKAHREYNCE